MGMVYTCILLADWVNTSSEKASPAGNEHSEAMTGLIEGRYLKIRSQEASREILVISTELSELQQTNCNCSFTTF